MQDEQTPEREHKENTTSVDIQQLIDDLGEAWQHPYEPTAETLKHTTQFIMGLPEKYRIAGLNAIAAHLVSCMSLHYLEIMATFQGKAEQEGIDQEEREGTFEDVLPDWFHKMMELSKQVSVRSVDDFVDLSNITTGWYRPSRVDKAEDAQRWMYRLPRVYYSRLEQENLVTQQSQLEATTEPTSNQVLNPPTEEFPFTRWRGRGPKAVPASLENGQASPEAA